MSDYLRYSALSAGVGISYWVITWFTVGLHAQGLLWLGVLALVALVGLEVMRRGALAPHRYDHLTRTRRRVVRCTQAVSLVTLLAAAILHGMTIVGVVVGTQSLSGSLDQVGAVLAVPLIVINAIANASLLVSTQPTESLLAI